MRKFDRWGDWHYFTMMPGIARSLIRPNPEAETLVRQYWYQDRDRVDPGERVPRDGVE